jgi:hypothetical protein
VSRSLIDETRASSHNRKPTATNNSRPALAPSPKNALLTPKLAACA